jgi:hypothetical protein
MSVVKRGEKRVPPVIIDGSDGEIKRFNWDKDPNQRRALIFFVFMSQRVSQGRAFRCCLNFFPETFKRLRAPTSGKRSEKLRSQLRWIREKLKAEKDGDDDGDFTNELVTSLHYGG